MLRNRIPHCNAQGFKTALAVYLHQLPNFDIQPPRLHGSLDISTPKAQVLKQVLEKRTAGEMSFQVRLLLDAYRISPSWRGLQELES